MIILFIGFFVNLSNAAVWEAKIYSTVIIKDITKLPDGSVYSNFEQTEQDTSNIGEYLISNCSGNRSDKKGELVEIIFFCKVEVDDGNKYWTKPKRTSGDSDAGASKFKLIVGPNSFNKLKATECKYSVSSSKNKIFGNNKASN